MGTTSKFKLVAHSAIEITRTSRQRTDLELDKDGLAESIQRLGVLQPIIVRKRPEPSPEGHEFILVAGERRLMSNIACGNKTIPARIFEELSPLEQKLYELDENLRRRELPWRDHIRAVADIHQTLIALNGEDWSQTSTAEYMGYEKTTLTKALRVWQDFDSPVVQNAGGFKEAYNALARRDERAHDDAMSDILSAVPVTPQGEIKRVGTEPRPGEPTKPAGPLPAEESILNTSFLEWAPTYDGRPFNFIHCDFPYGIEVFSGPQSGATRQSTYADGADVYWTLIECLCANLDKVMAPSAHLMFWLSADITIMYNTIEAFRKLAPGLTFAKKPLIWHKTCNTGVLADPQRGPRHVYEAALIASREDRKIIKATSDTYGSPTDKEYHVSTKAVPMLRYFFQMFVDQNTRLLDPTCGSGAALRAAESMGASHVLGLELDPEHHKAACSALKKDRVLRSAIG